MNWRDFFTTSSWWGKLFGACFGFLSGGPLGALFGILVGNFFDKGLSSHFANPHSLYHAETRKTVQKIFFESTFSIMGHIAKADGRVSEEEINMAKLLMAEMHLNREQKTLAKRLFNQGKQSHFPLDAVLTQLYNLCRDNRELLKLFIDIQYRVAQVDGLSAPKIQVLDTVFTGLGFAPLHQQNRFYDDFSYTSYQRYQEYQKEEQQNRQQSSSSYKRYDYQPKQTMNHLDHAYALLEVKPTSTKLEVKQAYRRLLSRNHPDKLTSQGLPEEMIKLANDKTQKIVKAYELICKSQGW